MLPMTLIAGIYGMNVPLWHPSGHPFSFWGVLGLMTVIGAVMLLYFRRRKWL